jgi:hypothetical protein
MLVDTEDKEGRLSVNTNVITCSNISLMAAGHHRS